MKTKTMAALLTVFFAGVSIAAQEAKAPEVPAAKADEKKEATPSTEAKKPETPAQEPYKPVKKISIAPAIPMGGVKELTQEQYENNLKDLATVTDALKEIQDSKVEGTKGDKEQEALLKERQAYLSFIVRSYECYTDTANKE